MQLRENPEWTVWWRPARDEVTGAVLWPERWDAESLAAREREIGPRAFARQYLLEPVSDDERTFPSEVIESCKDRQSIPGRVAVPDAWPRYAGVDLASSLGQKASWTVMFVAAIDPKSKRRYPVEIIRKRQRFPDTIRMIQLQWDKWRPQSIYVESNAFQAAVTQELSRINRSIPVRAYTTGREKMSPEIGIPSLSGTMANGSWLIPAGGSPHTPRCDCGWCAWVRELTLHPSGEYSDCTMGMWLCELAARDGRRAYIFDGRIHNVRSADSEPLGEGYGDQEGRAPNRETNDPFYFPARGKGTPGKRSPMAW